MQTIISLGCEHSIQGYIRRMNMPQMQNRSKAFSAYSFAHIQVFEGVQSRLRNPYLG